MASLKKVKPLGVTMGVRDFSLSSYWRSKLYWLDRLEVMGFYHDEAHQIARRYFLEHMEYTHFLFLVEDVIITPDMVAHLEMVTEEENLPVLCGYCNVAFHNDKVNITEKDLRPYRIVNQEQYGFPSVKEFLRRDLTKPLQKVFFQGNVLAIFRRDVIEKLTFKPYKYVGDSIRRHAFGYKGSHFGIMFDLQMALECAIHQVPIFCDTRLLCFHFGVTVPMISLKGKPRTVTLTKAYGEPTLIKCENPYF
jgi:hypothetical protein